MIVYALVDPRTSQVRYVGETVRKGSTRFAQHVRTARQQTTPPVNAWIRGLLDAGIAPVMVEIEEFSEKPAMHESEVFWIEQFRAMGAALLNIAPGGSTRVGYRHSEETKAKWRRERRGERAGNYGKRRTPEQKAMFAEITRQRWKDHPHPNLGKKRSPETIEKARAGRLGWKPSEEHKAALARGRAKRWAEYRAAKENSK